MQEYTDPVDRLVKLNEVIRFILLDEAVGEYLSEGPFGRSRGSGRPMPQRYIEAQRLRDSMKQQRISANFQRTMELKQRDLARSDAFREMVRQDTFNDAVARYKARRAGAQAAPATTGAAPTTGTQGTSPVATAQPDAGLPSAPGKGTTQTRVEELPAQEVRQLAAGEQTRSIVGLRPSDEVQAERDRNLATIKQKTAEAGLPSEEEREALGASERARRGVELGGNVDPAAVEASRQAAARGRAEDAARMGAAGMQAVPTTSGAPSGPGRNVTTDKEGVKSDIQTVQAKARAAGVAPGGPNAPDAREAARRERSERAMQGGLSLVSRKPVVQGPGQAAVSNVTRGMNQPQQGTSQAERMRTATQGQQSRGVTPNENLQSRRGVAPTRGVGY